MTTIILLEKNAVIPGAFDATDILVNYHVQAVQARFTWELAERVKAGDLVKIKDTMTGHWPHEAYVATIKDLDSKYPLWSVRDDRLALFLADFAGLVKEARLLWLDYERSDTPYEKDLHKLTKRTYEAFKGPKLRLQKDDQPAILAFVKGQVEALEDLPAMNNQPAAGAKE